MNQKQSTTIGLQSLAILKPERDAWPFITARLENPVSVGTRRQQSRWLRPAMAAVLLLSLGTITLLTQRVDEQDKMLQAWVSYSQELESELHQLRGANGAIRGHQAIAIDQLEDMLAMVDWQLSQTNINEQDQLPLWQRRAALLNDLVTVRAGQRLLPPAQQQQPVVTLSNPTTLIAYEL